jgi:hypothetical protein
MIKQVYLIPITECFIYNIIHKNHKEKYVYIPVSSPECRAES